MKPFEKHQLFHTEEPYSKMEKRSSRRIPKALHVAKGTRGVHASHARTCTS